MANNISMPFLPGYSFSDPTVTKFGLKQTLEYRKGCALPKVLIPDTAEYSLELLDAENHLYDDILIELTYGPKRQFLQKREVPHTVAFDKQVLRFYGYFREEIGDHWGESFRIHHVIILYHLEDDTLEVYEPWVSNSGLPQGLIIRKRRHPQSKGEGDIHWKNLNNHTVHLINGREIHLVDCDTWTKEFLKSNGVVLNPPIEEIPKDPHAKKREAMKFRTEHEPGHIEDEKLWKFLNFDRHVLRFYGLCDDTLFDAKEKRKVVILYYLADDTMEVHEVFVKNSGRDPIPSFIKRHKIPFDLKCLPEAFPSSYLEISDKEVKKWFTPEDFGIGKTIMIYNHKLLLYDCDQFTRKFYKDTFNINMPEAIDISEKPKSPISYPVPPHTGLGTWEDSLQSCIYTSELKPPKKDMWKKLYSDDNVLRYSAYMDTVWSIDRSRQFVITFYPSDDTLSIHERKIVNSGIIGGHFLRRCRLRKNDNSTDRPVYYTASDLYIGGTITAVGRKFIIDDADLYVLTFMNHNPEIYSAEKIEAHRKKAEKSRPAEEVDARFNKLTLKEEMRKHIVKRFGEEPLPLPVDLKTNDSQDTMKARLYAANIPIPQSYLKMAMDFCTDNKDKLNVEEFKDILSHAFGHEKK